MAVRPRLAALLLGLPVLVVLGLVVFIDSGHYDIGADVPHSALTLHVIEKLRDASTVAHSRGIAVPDLDQPMQIESGAKLYASECSGCHLAPGKRTSDLRTGLYPQPPDLSHDGIDDPAEAFWIIKHGIKMSAMPAWGKTLSDADIWDAVALLQKLPHMSPAQYQGLAGPPHTR